MTVPNRVLERLPSLRKITNSSLVQRPLAVARRYRLVEERAAFAFGELRRGTHSYHLAVAPQYRVVVRHGTRDMGVFDEIFRSPRAYDPPAEAAVLLDAVSARQPLRVLDLGGNIGMFALDVLSRYPTAHITSYEPDPQNFSVLARCAAINDAGWDVIQACAMTIEQPVHFSSGDFAHSHVSDTGVAVRGIDTLPLLDGHDYIKMDIEGSEWPILRDPRWPTAMQNVAVFVLEWHTRGSVEADARQAAMAAVGQAGFVMSADSPGWWDHGMIWGWRPTLH